MPGNSGRNEVNETVEAALRNLACFPNIVIALAVAGHVSLAEAFREYVEGSTKTLPFPNPIDGPLSGNYVAACTIAVAATQIQDVSLRDRSLKLAAELVSSVTLQDLGVSAPAGIAAAQ
jgi:hypothetical protein